MRTKSLLLAAAALAAGVLSSQAQTVYSANIVGYVNSPLNPGYTSLSVPLDASGGNSLTNVIPNPTGALDFNSVYLWNGKGYTILTLDSSWPTGVGDQADLSAVPAPTINPGQMFYFFNAGTVFYTNTFVGTVHADLAATGTQTVGVNTNTLPPGYSFVASKLPIAGGVQSVLGFTNTAGTLDGGNLVYVPTINAAGKVTGYNIVTFDSGFSTGFGDASDLSAAPEPIIPVGGGFIFFNQGTTTFTWTQSL